MKLKEFLRERPEYLAELEDLEREAELGRRYLAGLRSEVARLGGLAERSLGAGVLKSIVDKLDEGELLELKKAYEKRAGERFGAETQLTYREDGPAADGRDGAFLV